MAEGAQDAAGDTARHVLLVGMMGAGKSTVGPLVASRLGWSFVDTDQVVEHDTGKTVRELFAEGGEKLFRAEEARALAGVLALRAPTVVSVGGGAVMLPGNRTIIGSSGTVVWLRAAPRTLASRVGDGASRPLISTEAETLEALARIESERRPLYEEVSDAVVDTDVIDAGEVAGRVVELVRVAPSRPAQRSGGRAP
ncbi:MAG TPA: shikimate kinase [Acidimicrobiales bacterium]|nr:shikimate kinase [Acidimicrobiales bacterium]